MAKSLLIVESPTKIKTIRKYLGPDFVLKASVGHVKDLPPKKLGVDIKHEFTPEFKVIEGKAAVLKDIKAAAAKAENIYLAPDPDREGEAIAWHLAEEIKGSGKKIQRVMFHEMTGDAIRQALKEAGEIHENRFEAQKARRVLDRLVGYQVSPLLWQNVRRGLSAGRVQSVALRIICEREAEIDAFVKEEYWTIDAHLLKQSGEGFVARLTKKDGKKLTLPDEASGRAVVSELKTADFVVAKVAKKQRQRHPRPPFTTSTMQQEASSRLRFSARKTMMVAQQLYEGLDIGPEGPVGLITYMRTDSIRVSNEATKAARKYIGDQFGKNYLPGKTRQFRNKKNIQDAHEAVRPTAVSHTPESVKPYLDKNQFALYELIWRRFLASQMASAKYDQTAVDVAASSYTLHATGNVITFKGFLSLYDEPEGNGPDQSRLPELSEGERLALDKLDPQQHFTQPPPRFTESSLVKELEELGIGRPSTYAAILSTLQERKYVDRKDRTLSPTELGKIVNVLLVSSFPDIFNVEFTASMEEQLDAIVEGKATYLELLSSFYDPFEKDLSKAKKEMKNMKAAEEPTSIECNKCGRKMVIKWGRNGNFLACSGYPECRNTSDFERDADGTIRVAEKKAAVDEVCEKCGLPMTLKRGRYGEFLACTGYPDCRNTRKLNGSAPQPQEAPKEAEGVVCPECGGPMLIRKNRWGGEFLSCASYPKCKGTRPISSGMPCPEPGCKGEVIERRSRRGKKFYGCSRYPDCEFTSWNRPLPETCPMCGSPYLEEKYSKKDGKFKACPQKNCKFKDKLAD